jgi:hypothetical protein
MLVGVTHKCDSCRRPELLPADKSALYQRCSRHRRTVQGTVDRLERPTAQTTFIDDLRLGIGDLVDLFASGNALEPTGQ